MSVRGWIGAGAAVLTVVALCLSGLSYVSYIMREAREVFFLNLEAAVWHADGLVHDLQSLEGDLLRFQMLADGPNRDRVLLGIDLVHARIKTLKGIAGHSPSLDVAPVDHLFPVLDGIEATFDGGGFAEGERRLETSILATRMFAAQLRQRSMESSGRVAGSLGTFHLTVQISIAVIGLGLTGFIVLLGRQISLSRNLEWIVAERTRTLRASEATLSNAQRIAHVGSWSLDIASGGLTWSDEIFRIFGMDRSTFGFNYKAFLELVHPDDRAYVDRQFTEALEGRRPYDIEHRIVRRSDGAVRWVHEICEHTRDHNGKVLRSDGTVQDITERKQAEFLRATNSRRLRLLLDLNKDLPSLTDRDLLSRALDIAVTITDSKIGYLHFVNEDQRSLSLSTWNGEALKLCTAAFDRHYPIEQAGIWADSVRTKAPVVHNDYAAIPDKPGYPVGHFPVIRHMGAPVMDGDQVRMVIGVGNKEEAYDDNDVIQLQMVANDVEKLFMRRLAELELEQKTELLERSNSDLQQFAYVSSHDLREPLRMVSSYLQLLERKYTDSFDDTARQYIGFAVDGAQRMDRLIRDLLRYSRVHTHGDAFAAVRTSAVVSEALANLRAALSESDGQVEVADLPDVLGDRSQVLRLFQNLIENALKYRSPDRPPRVRITARASGDMVEFAVEDNGIGIDARYAERIFVIFQRLHPREEYDGTGIGLAICKRIVERHGGRIWVEGAAGEGSTFRFTLPEGPKNRE